MKKIELLVPAKNMECLKVAVENGADSVYLGAKEFNARTLNTDNNFTLGELKEAIKYCRKNDVNTNLTLNTLIKDVEFKQALELANFAYKAGVSAIIVQDIGLGKELIEKYPNLDIHASTQNTITNIDGVKMLEKIGYKRAILSRELSMKEIENICKQSNIEIETFIHGGLCISYSGQCLFSSVEYGLAGNRGMCVGSCRNEYDLIENNEITRNGKVLKPKDMCGLEYIPSLIKCGVKCLKIQGRTRGIDYIQEVTRIYRKYIDLALSDNEYVIDRDDYKKLKQMSSRGVSNAHFSQKSNNNFIVDTKFENIDIAKTKIDKKQLEIVSDNNNRKTEIVISFEHLNEKEDYSVLSDKVKRIYIPIDEFENNYNIIKNLENRFELFIETPLIILQNGIKDYKKQIEKILRKFKIKGFVLSNISDYYLIEEYKNNYIFIGNYSLNIFNSNSCEVLRMLGIQIITPSIELGNDERINLIEKNYGNFEEIVYGRIPLINMKYCIKENVTVCCDNCPKNCQEKYFIKDINNVKEYECKNSKKQILTKIYGSKKISLNSCSPKSSSRIFVHDENINEINEIINNIINGNYYKGNDYINNIVVK